MSMYYFSPHVNEILVLKSLSNMVHFLFLITADKEIMTFDAGKMKVADILGQFSKKCKEKEDS